MIEYLQRSHPYIFQGTRTHICSASHSAINKLKRLTTSVALCTKKAHTHFTLGKSRDRGGGNIRICLNEQDGCFSLSKHFCIWSTMHGQRCIETWNPCKQNPQFEPLVSLQWQFHELDFPLLLPGDAFLQAYLQMEYQGLGSDQWTVNHGQVGSLCELGVNSWADPFDSYQYPIQLPCHPWWNKRKKTKTHNMNIRRKKKC